MFFATDFVLASVERARIILQCLEGKAVNAIARDLKNRPSWEKEALIIGGSSAAGAGIGALAGGKKGAGIGAASGGIAGLVYDPTTRNK